MMVWTRLPSWISHSSLSMKQSRRHWVRGLREKNSKTTKFALGAAISDWCTLKLYFRHILILTEGNVGRYNKTIYSVSVSASLVPLWFSCWSFAWSWKKLGVWSFSKDLLEGQSFVSPSKSRWERIGRQGLPANLSLISHFPAIPGILGLIFISLPKAQRTRGLSSAYQRNKFLHKSWSNSKIDNLNQTSANF